MTTPCEVTTIRQALQRVDSGIFIAWTLLETVEHLVTSCYLNEILTEVKWARKNARAHTHIALMRFCIFLKHSIFLRFFFRTVRQQQTFQKQRPDKKG